MLRMCTYTYIFSIAILVKQKHINKSALDFLYSGSLSLSQNPKAESLRIGRSEII